MQNQVMFPDRDLRDNEFSESSFREIVCWTAFNA